MDDLSHLKASRKVAKFQITRSETFVDSFPEDGCLFNLESRLSELSGYYKEYNTLQTKIEVILLAGETDETKVNALEAELNEDRDKVTNKYYATVGKIKSILAKKGHVSGNGDKDSQTVINITGNKLPNQTDICQLKPLPLPTFSGKYTEWFTFFDSFKSLVHNDQTIINIRKFHYLRGCLTGDALRAIESLSVSGANYPAAIELLQKRFENKRLIAQEHITNILRIKGLTQSSHTDLRKLIDDVNNNVAALKTLELPVNHWDALLITIISEKLDPLSMKEWQVTLTKDLPTYQAFSLFLEKRYQILESINVTNSNNHNNNQQSVKHQQSNFKNSTKNLQTFKSKYNTNIISTTNCLMCNDKNHQIFYCQKFKNLSLCDKLKHVETLKLCKNCLRNGHYTNNCKSTGSCKTCQGKHHTLLHVNEFQPQASTSANTLVVQNTNLVLFSTVVLLIADSQGKFHECRAVLDQCSEVCLITNKLTKRLKLQSFANPTTITGVNLSKNHTSECVNVTIKSRVSDFSTSIDCYTLPKITQATPPVTFSPSLVEIPPNIILADPNFNICQDVDLLIGAKLFWSLLIGGPMQISQNQPFLQSTHFGYIVSGSIDVKSNLTTKSCNLTVLNNTHDNLESQVAKFWEQEEVEHKPTWSSEQLACEKHFVNNTYRAENGQFVVSLPFKHDPITLNSQLSQKLALKQFFQLEQKLESNSELKTLYSNFMQEYQLLDHMEAVPLEEVEKPNTFYLPHFAVFKQTIEGPKIRVVYNASAPSNCSLNDNLMTGPTIQDDLFSLLCRFRTYRYVLSADIVKMYRAILLHPNDRDLHRIFWRNSLNKPIEIFRLKTVTYGTTSASFLATRALHELANQTENSKIATIIKNDFYMDDLLTGSQSLIEAAEIKREITKILQAGGFTLAKWASNNPQLLSSENSSNSESVSFDDQEMVKILGFHWQCKDDILTYNVNLPSIKIVTKRVILSTVSRLFDPLGLINPIIVTAKILIQKLWTLKLNWDEPVPEEIEKVWSKFANELVLLNSYKIPRNLNSHNPVLIEIHAFSDSSIKAFGACVYLRVIDQSGKIFVNLLCAKSRVAPLKTVTLPRLELNAAALSISLVCKVTESLNLNVHKTFFWTDSTIVLQWLSEPPSNWKQYVANRVARIQSYSSREQWNHVRSESNPSDIVSRGASAYALQNCNLWWSGPNWLSKPQNEWPISWSNSLLPDSKINLEKKSRLVVNTITIEPELPVFSKVSSFSKLCRIIAYCLRFVKNTKRNTEKSHGSLTLKEISKAENITIKYIQNRAFSSEINALINNKPNTFSKKLLTLDPFLDSEGLLRVGGRLKNAPIGYNMKHPLLLPAKHHVTKIIITHVHLTEMHAGHTATLAAVRQKFWIISGRNAVKKVIHNCFRCNRVHPKMSNQKMGDLPASRLQPQRPFYISGVDFMGPFLIKENTSRNSRKVKAYVALFICFATKAVHLELVGNLTTENFLAAFKRFVSRRGNVSELYCDNGSNFVGAHRELSTKFQHEISEKLSEKLMKFNFIPARSPHFGGLWERAVKSVKHHLYRVVGDASLTYEEFYTFLSAIEACMNSRPLTPLSPDPNDLEVLTPGHFLIGAPLTTPIEPDLKEIKVTRLSRWQRVQQLHQHFWERWHREYLAQLQERPKRQQEAITNIDKGALVVLIEDNTPPLRWKLGRVEATHPGEDGLVRVVSVRTVNGLFKRAIKKVCVIPNDE